jgi:hypothetical protein
MKASHTPKPQPRPIMSAKRATARFAGGVAGPGDKEVSLRVRTAMLPGGYRVFGAPVEPEHTTRDRIAVAVVAARRLTEAIDAQVR